MEQYKTCTKCGQIKPLSEFGKRSDSKDGRKSRCRPCVNAVNREWQKTDKARAYGRTWAAANPEKRALASKKYWQKNPEKLAEKRARGSKVWRERYPEKANARSTAWRIANPEKTKAIGKRYRDNHPEKASEKARHRRAVVRDLASEKYTEQQILAMWGSLCHICNLQIDLSANRRIGAEGWEKSLHLDHVIPISKGGSNTPDNVKPAHGRCNLKKGASLPSGG